VAQKFQDQAYGVIRTVTVVGSDPTLMLTGP